MRFPTQKRSSQLDRLNGELIDLAKDRILEDETPPCTGPAGHSAEGFRLTLQVFYAICPKRCQICADAP